ncbi:type I methionyl aminopeptidase [Mesoaciditoga lauensis]|uniref:type I methionyl aminopeptidase n=1 Tax=Mesoaciditoga lauensis TaxID=1495039 RepID=UPI000569667F|nr:type I methionyl aminopeptidase [Mesoaciditoga lauensis]
MIRLKSEHEIDEMRYPNAIVGEVLAYIKEYVVDGVTTYDLDRLIEEYFKKRNVIPAFKGYAGFPAAACISLNEMVVHGIPSKKVVVKNGDLVSIDVGTIHNGWYGDGARTYIVGEVDEKRKELVEVTKASFFEGIKMLKVGNRLGDVSHAIQSLVESHGFSVIRDYVGHGIGRNLHEEPQVPNFGKAGTDIPLRNGLVIAIEPMVSMGTWKVKVLEDGWGVVTLDGSPSAHYENTVVLHNGKVEILTMPEGLDV